MDLLGKDSKEYMEAIKTPLIIAVALAVIGIIVNAVLGLVGKIPLVGGMLDVITSLLLGVGSLVIGIILAFYIGWTIVKARKGTIVHALVGGALFGLIAGLISGLVGVINAIVNMALGVGGAMGAGLGIGFAVAGIATGPIIGLIIDGIIALIGGLAAQMMGGK